MDSSSIKTRSSAFVARTPASLFVISGAVLWGLDGLFRRHLAQTLHASTIVFSEHLIAVLFLLPLLPRSIRSARQNLDAKGWIALLLVGAGASAVATILFTEAFGRGDPITPLVLQKLQPFIAVLGARYLLGERLKERYWGYFAIAVAGAWMLTFPQPFHVHTKDAEASLLAIGAAMLWGMGTVLGRHLSKSLRFEEITTLRYTIGLITMIVILPMTHSPATTAAHNYVPLLFMALITGGLISLLLYYVGMQRTPASIATLDELAFPLTAAVIGYAFLGGTLTASQWVGGAVLCATVTALGWRSARSAEKVGVKIPASFELASSSA